jgi:hypothetical protein
MNPISFQFVLILIVASLSGCHVITPRIVTTEIRKTDKGFEIISPKDTDVFFAGKPDGHFVFRYTAKASPDALQAGSQEAANRSAAVGKLAEAAAALK